MVNQIRKMIQQKMPRMIQRQLLIRIKQAGQLNKNLSGVENERNEI